MGSSPIPATKFYRAMNMSKDKTTDRVYTLDEWRNSVARMWWAIIPSSKSDLEKIKDWVLKNSKTLGDNVFFLTDDKTVKISCPDGFRKLCGIVKDELNIQFKVKPYGDNDLEL